MNFSQIPVTRGGFPLKVPVDFITEISGSKMEELSRVVLPLGGTVERVDWLVAFVESAGGDMSALPAPWLSMVSALGRAGGLRAAPPAERH